jgi:hypothetical protein
MKIIGNPRYTRPGDGHKADVDDERNHGEDQGETREEEGADSKTAMLA